MAYADQANNNYNKSMSNVKFLPGNKGTNSYRNIAERPKMKTITDIKGKAMNNPIEKEKPAFNRFALEREANAIHEHSLEETPVERKTGARNHNFERRESSKVSKAMALMNKYANLRKSEKSESDKNKNEKKQKIDLKKNGEISKLEKLKDSDVRDTLPKQYKGSIGNKG